MNNVQLVFLIITVVVFAVFIGGWFYFNIDLPDSGVQVLGNNSEEEIPIRSAYDNKVVYTTDMSYGTDVLKNDCQARGGTFNACGSICSPEMSICTDVCAYTCDSINQAKESTVEADVMPPSSPKSVDSTGNGKTDSLAGEVIWKEYLSGGLGFSIAYRHDMKIEESAIEPRVSFLWMGPKQVEGTELFDGISISIVKRSYGAARNLVEFANNEIKIFETVDKLTKAPTPIMVNDVYGMTYSLSALGDYDIYILPQSEKFLLVVSILAPDPRQSGYSHDVQRMLDSFLLLPASAKE